MNDEKNIKILEVDTDKSGRHVSRRCATAINYH
jgi:hypothetical protein